MVTKRENTKHIATFSGQEKVVAMTEHNGIVFVATTYNIYEIIGNKLVALELKK